MRIYIVGVCGTFMGGLARIAAELGHEVGGCDAAVYPPMSTQLEQAGITVDAGYEPAHVERGWDCFVIGNALSRGNPLIEEILRRRLPFVSGPEWLAREVLGGRRVLAVAGTHGKTTTTTMLAWILDRACLAPGFLIGGVPVPAPASTGFPLGFDVSARADGMARLYAAQRLTDPTPFLPADAVGDAAGDMTGDIKIPFAREIARALELKCFVIEADEYDTAFFDKRPKFIHYRPDVLVLNNLEFDHADIYADLEAIERQFHFLLRTVPGDGVVLYRAGDAALRAVLDLGAWTPCESFGLSGDAHAGPDRSDWFAEAHAGGFRVFHRGREQGECRWAMFGAHNVANALAAVAAAHHAGVAVEAALAALADFQGVRRRLEIKGEAAGVVVYDDFAHHPSAIRATLAAVAGRVANAAAGGRILAVFEPRSNTMKMGRHNEDLAQAFADADKVFCRRPAELARVVDPAVAKTRAPALVFDDAGELLARLRAEVRDGDHVVFMSNGGFDNLPARLARALPGAAA